MNRSESRYFNTAVRMDEALIELLEKKSFEYITVKEICQRAGVNRSTFYLHYETMADLLNECAEYTNRKCFDRYGKEYADMSKRLSSADLNELIFITPDYLRPYFEFVKENRRLIKVALSHPAALNTETTFHSLFQNIFSPVLGRFRFREEDKPYIIRFYLSGFMAIVAEWIKDDCRMPVDRIIGLCMQCILPDGAEAQLSRFAAQTEEQPV